MKLQLQNSLPENHLEHQVELTSKMRAILVDWLIDVWYSLIFLLSIFIGFIL